MVLSRNHFWCGRAVRVLHSECESVALVTWHTKRMRRIIMPSMACPAAPYISTLSHKRQDLRKYVFLNVKYVFLIFCNICLKLLSFRVKLSDTLSKCTRVFVKSIRLEHLWQIFGKCSYTKCYENPSRWIQGRTQRHDEADSRFEQFCERA